MVSPQPFVIRQGWRLPRPDARSFAGQTIRGCRKQKKEKGGRYLKSPYARKYELCHLYLCLYRPAAEQQEVTVLEQEHSFSRFFFYIVTNQTDFMCMPSQDFPFVLLKRAG